MNIGKFLPEAREPMAKVHSHIPKTLRDDVIEQFVKDKAAGIPMTWEELITAACKAYLEQRKRAR